MATLLKFFKKYCITALIIVILAGLTAPAAQAQDEPEATASVYDYAWLQEVAALPADEAIAAINDAWESRSGLQWKSAADSAGTYAIVAHSVVIGSMNAGNDPAFQSLGINIWYTAAGGRFGTREGFRAFQLDGAVNATTHPTNVADMLAMVADFDTYGEQITFLDVEWSSSPEVVNRWGTSGPVELLTDEQEAALKAAGLDLQPIKQLLPLNTIVWGEKVANCSKGVRTVGINIHVTTGDGAYFCTLRGFRAMQMGAATAENK